MIHIAPAQWTPALLNVLWDSYLHGRFDYPWALTQEGFEVYFAEQMKDFSAIHIGYHDGVPVALLTTLIKDGYLEPHVVFFPIATPRVIIACFYKFFEMVRADFNLKGCLLRSHSNTKHVYDFFCKKGILQYLRTIIDRNVPEFQYIVRL